MSEAAAVSLGQRVKTRRQSLGWSIDQLSARSGLSKGTLVAIEGGASNPSLSTLVGLADVFGISFSELLGELPIGFTQLFLHDQARVLWTGEFGGEARLITTVRGPVPVEIWMWTMNAGDRYVGPAHPVGVSETVTVVDGELTVTLHETATRLPAGSTLAMEAHAPHSYEATIDQTRFLMTVHVNIKPL